MNGQGRCQINSVVIAWFSAGFVAAFWAFLGTRIFVMWRRGVSVLTIAVGRPLLNAFGTACFMGVFVAWTGVFVYVAFFPSAFILFRPWWDTEAGAGSALTWAGALLAVAGQSMMWASVVTMGRAWRVGIDSKSPGALVTQGVFRLSRNPIFLGLNTVTAAAFLIQPNAFFLLCAACFIAGFHFQILGEERHLEKTYGDAYTRYRECTPRYLLFL